MQRITPTYLHLRAGEVPPELDYGPFRVVVVIEEAVTEAWRAEVSEWLVRGGCLYMMAWGRECGRWDESVDYASLEEFDYGDIPDDRSVITTWHDDEVLSEAFWFAAYCASHPTVELDTTLILHIAATEQKDRLLKLYEEATDENASVEAPLASLGLGGDGDEIAAIEHVEAHFGVTLDTGEAPGWITAGDVYDSLKRVLPPEERNEATVWAGFAGAIARETAVDPTLIRRETILLAPALWRERL